MHFHDHDYDHNELVHLGFMAQREFRSGGNTVKSVSLILRGFTEWMGNVHNDGGIGKRNASALVFATAGEMEWEMV